MYELRPAPKNQSPIPSILVGVGIVIGIPIAYAVLLIVSAFLKGLLGW